MNEETFVIEFDEISSGIADILERADYEWSLTPSAAQSLFDAGVGRTLDVNVQLGNGSNFFATLVNRGEESEKRYNEDNLPQLFSSVTFESLGW